ncbi:MAG: isochorismatase family protein [Planctomycetota bacterium]|jgi:protein-tyrosine phosphatase/nicotinamidase-related amidase
MPTALLITQCLQNDFVKPIGRFDPIPNRLHVGYAEAQRLMGANPAEGPVARVMQWAYAQPDEELRVIHIRDWHDPADPVVRAHLDQFGDHCLQGTPGAEFAFPVPESHTKQVDLVGAFTLNDFQGTNLAEVLAPCAGQPCRVGLTGVWTEAKISFLAYELTTRYPEFDVAVCSALTASASRQGHFQALDRLERILGVRRIDSVGKFVEFLGGADEVVPLVGLPERHPSVDLAGADIPDDDRTLIRYLFRDCRSVKLNLLDGGFSGNLVAGSASIDQLGHEQAPHVVKIGPRDEMGRERASFERIQEVLGNNAPQISEFADYGDRGAIKYRYASMGGTFSTTLQKAYMGGRPLPEIRTILETVFGEQLMRLYKAATLEHVDLLAYWEFDSKWARSVRKKVESILGVEPESAALEILPGLSTPNVCRFYEETLAHLPPRPHDQAWMAYVHGDLNGANIILDGHDNVWLIDFFHTHRGHVLRDLVKFENDLLYIFTPVDSDEELRDACRLTDALLDVADLGVPLPEPPGGLGPQFDRAWATIAMLREFYPRVLHASRNPWQLHVAQLRYAVHNLGFYESNARQLKWALYTAGRCAELVERQLNRDGSLRLDWLPAERTAPGRVALTLLPGRRDFGRDLARDLQTITEAGVTHVVCLVPEAELHHYGVDDLPARYAAAGLEVHHLPVLDQAAPSVAAAREAVAWMEAAVADGGAVLAHCVGGLGRTGLLAACWLRARGAGADDAVAAVRAARSPRAIETAEQLEFVRAFSAER